MRLTRSNDQPKARQGHRTSRREELAAAEGYHCTQEETRIKRSTLLEATATSITAHSTSKGSRHGECGHLCDQVRDTPHEEDSTRPREVQRENWVPDDKGKENRTLRHRRCDAKQERRADQVPFRPTHTVEKTRTQSPTDATFQRGGRGGYRS